MSTAITKLNTLTVNSSTTLLNRIHAFFYTISICALLCHRLYYFSSLLSLVLFTAEFIFAFMSITAQAFKWSPVSRKEFPEQLSDRESWPELDVFVCTTDPFKEPPAIVASTVLSALGFDYPAKKLSVYVSDDGGSELTLFGLLEAAKFAKHWVPFCRENGVEIRSPGDFVGRFNGGGCAAESLKLKKMYDEMIERIEGAMERGFVGDELLICSEDHEIFMKFKGFNSREHPAVIQVLLDGNKDKDQTDSPLPNLVYVSREKHPAFPHHFKAGALNALVRVSSLMSNAPVILSLDCDMKVNDPKAPHRALCYLLDKELSAHLAYVQFPQAFEGINSSDIYGCRMIRIFHINPMGLDGLLGPDNFGTGCFFSRRCFQGKTASDGAGFGSFDGFNSSEHEKDGFVSITTETVLSKAHHVACCTYEKGTEWGYTIGVRYGSLVEDFFTGYLLHCEGWQSVLSNPERPAFIGAPPTTLNDALYQIKRWSVGNLEVAFSKFSPLFYGTKRASLLQGLGYTHYACWPFWCIPITIYGLFPQVALIYCLPLFPKVINPWFYLYAYTFLAAYGQDLWEFINAGGTIRQWWCDQRVWMIRGVTSFLFGFTEFIFKQLHISTPGFTVTNKIMEDQIRERYNKEIMEFGVNSPFFITIGSVAIVNLMSCVVGAIRALKKEMFFDEMFAQMFLSIFISLNCWPVYEAMFLRRDAGRMPTRITCLSILLGVLVLSIAYFPCTTR